MSLAPKLAFRNLFHDRLRFIATVIGIVFSIVLVTVQMGLYLGFERMVTIMIDHAAADLWIVPRGTKCFEDLPCSTSASDFERCRSRAWRRSPGGDRLCAMAHAHRRHHAGLHRSARTPAATACLPWNLVEGSIEVARDPGRGRGRPILFRPARDHAARRNAPKSATRG